MDDTTSQTPAEPMKPAMPPMSQESVPAASSPEPVPAPPMPNPPMSESTPPAPVGQPSSDPVSPEVVVMDTDHAQKKKSGKMIWIVIGVIILLCGLIAVFFMVKGMNTKKEVGQVNVDAKQKMTPAPTRAPALDTAGSLSSSSSDNDLDKDLQSIDSHLSQVAADQVDLNQDQGSDTPESL